MRQPRILAAALALCAAAAALAGCGAASGAPEAGGTVLGAPQGFAGGSARTYVVRDAAGNPAEVGLRVSAGALENLPQADGDPHAMAVLALPPEARDTIFDHVEMGWNPHGHEPLDLFGRPHFDFHFYMARPDEVMAIDPGRPDFAALAARFPEPKYVPQDYTAPPGPPEASTIPQMGLHWTDSTTGVVPGRYDFKQIFINGTWDGRYTFMEPMITRDFLLSKAPVDEPIKQPAAFQYTGFTPTHYSVRFDEAAQEWVIALSGMRMQTRS